MTNRNADELIRTAVGAVRAPFAIADMQIVRFRGEDSRVRFVPQTAIGLLDSLVAHIAPGPTQAASPRTATAPESAPVTVPEPADEPAGAAPLPTEVVEERADQLAADRKSREHKASRSNKSVTAIARDLAVADAVADAHEHRTGGETGEAGEAVADEVDVEELGPRDFGPPSSS